MNKRQIEQLRKPETAVQNEHETAVQNEHETAANEPLKCRCQSTQDNDNALLARFYAARLVAVNTATRMDGAEKQMRVALHEARTALKVWKDGLGNE